ncbi:phosphate acyltransferase PlsX [Ruminococcaceae bacterium OttesenSCG-928-A11]|nr:phosphate acyltransferase PlsX [Ruminococcaceae bacterium OttesenSCG-928-A11]
MKIILDAMGGDNAPLAPLQGAADAVRELGVEVICVGDEPVLKGLMAQNSIPADGLTIVHAPDSITMEDESTDVLKRKESSLYVAMEMLKNGEGDAFVGAGSTGATLVAATMVAGRIKGVKRAALATVMPGGQNPWMLIDIGANVECRPEMLVQFAAMGSAYMEKVMKVEKPKVALANNGTEATKGTDLQLNAYPMLEQSSLNFVGNIEAREIPQGVVADVVVCDGFTGNIILKLTEGVAKMFSGLLKEMIYKNTATKIGGALLKGGLADFKKKMDYTEYGGAPMLGIKYPVIKAHGSSNAKSIKSAIRQAKIYTENDVPGTIEAWIKENKAKDKEAKADDEA